MSSVRVELVYTAAQVQRRSCLRSHSKQMAGQSQVFAQGASGQGLELCSGPHMAKDPHQSRKWTGKTVGEDRKATRKHPAGPFLDFSCHIPFSDRLP